MVDWRRERRRWVAILAAYALVLQVVLAGFGAGVATAAPAPALDAFGGVICAFDGVGHGDPGQPSPAHHRDLDCLSHCALSFQAALPPTAASDLAVDESWHLDVPARVRAAALPPAPAIGPLGPRGPPA
jgi:hypothetical protein